MFHYFTPPWRGQGYERNTCVLPLPIRVDDTEQLLALLGGMLRFPPYYGRNFDAFWDCVRELDGFAERKIVLVHSDLPEIPIEWLTVYLEVLRDAENYWVEHAEEHVFEAWFPEAEQARIACLVDPRSFPAESG